MLAKTPIYISLYYHPGADIRELIAREYYFLMLLLLRLWPNKSINIIEKEAAIAIGWTTRTNETGERMSDKMLWTPSSQLKNRWRSANQVK
jgi:hypothetical protein